MLFISRTSGTWCPQSPAVLPRRGNSCQGWAPRYRAPQNGAINAKPSPISTFVLCRASTTEQEAGAVAEVAAAASLPVYAGVVFDMDGTLTISNIDFVDMRNRTGIPSGDLFTVMESWDDGDKIKKSMDVILELEAKAAADLEVQPGLLGVLAFLRDSKVRVGLVTRNTTESVDAFFGVIGEEWRSLFDPVLTREFKYVKPDKRSLQHFSEAWGLPAYQLLMVGDSTEDVETGNAAGTATCLIAGGGNEVVAPPTPAASSSSSSSSNSAPTAPPAMPAGAVPSFVVHSLHELLERLQARDTPLGWGALRPRSSSSASTSSVSVSSREGTTEEGVEDDGGYYDWLPLEQMYSPGDFPEAEGRAAPSAAAAAPPRPALASLLPGAPPPGLSFLDSLFASGAVAGAHCSFPRIDGARFGVPPDEHPGDRVLHVGCGDAALTKMLASSGLQVVAMDLDVSAAQRRGLRAVPLPLLITPDSLVASLGPYSPQSFDAVVFFGALDEGRLQGGAEGGLEGGWHRPQVLAALAGLRKLTGRLCVEAWVDDTEQLRRDLGELGMEVGLWQELGTSPVSGRKRVRLIAG